MNDESYIQMDFNQLPGQKHYLVTGRGDVASKNKFVFADKFAKKAMVWQAIYSCGKKTVPYVTGQTMATERYKTECLDNRVLPKKFSFGPIWQPAITPSWSWSGTGPIR